MRDKLKTYIQPSFLICVAILATAGGLKKVAIEWLGLRLQKEPIPLKKSLDLLDTSTFSPYQVVESSRIENKDILEQLGTEDYAKILLEDTEVNKNSSVRYCSLFITYYTGNPDAVPHIPDECHVGSGSQREKVKEVILKVGGINDNDDPAMAESNLKEIKARYLVFLTKGANAWQASSRYPVLYFFKANGEYSGSRGETREVLGKNLLGKYSYFSKVEFTFYGSAFGRNVYPDGEEFILACEKFLSLLLPVMEKDYWPDWETS